jgi:hypothetical protein
MTEELIGRDLPIRTFKEKPVVIFQGKSLEVERYCDLGGGVYWFVAEEQPEYGVEEEKGAENG